jgi:hypothetical protein
MRNVNAVDPPPVAQTLPVPLACRANEAARPDALIQDSRAVNVFEQIGSGTDYLMELWGLCLLDQWGYFDRREPRLALANLKRLIPPVNRMNTILHYRFGEKNDE